MPKALRKLRFEVFLNSVLMLAQLELEGRASSRFLGLESPDFVEELQIMQASGNECKSNESLEGSL